MKRPITVISLRTFPAIVLLLVGGRAFSAGPGEGDGKPATAAMPELIRQYQADGQSVQGAFGLPASAAAFDRMERLLKTWRKRLDLVDYEALGRSEKIDYLLLENEICRSLDAIARQRKRLAEIDPLVGFRDIILELEQARRRCGPLDSPAAAAKLADLAVRVKQIRERVEKGAKSSPNEAKPDAKGAADAPLAVSPGRALYAADIVKSLRETLDGWYKYYSGFSPEFDWWSKRPCDEARTQLEEYAKLLREEVAGQKGKEDDPLVGVPLGPEAIAADIGFEFLPYTAEELIAVGEREMAWCEGKMREASRQMGLGDDWKAALARVKTEHAPPGQQDELIARIGREATAFVTQRKLVTVPPLCQDTWRLAAISTGQLKSVPYAAYGGQQMMVAYAQQNMSQEDKLMVMRGNNRHFMRLVTPHELIPGHHLQAFYAARYNTHRQLFATPFYVEGWALYWELRLWDLGWAKTPEDRIGILFWRMTRAARIVVTLKFHLGQMQPGEMVAYLMDRVGHEKLGATAEVRRFIGAAPLYQVGYMVGGKQLAALHNELVGGGTMTEEHFHDTVLRAGPIPIAALRSEMVAAPLGRNAKPRWRFTDNAGKQDREPPARESR